jgi:hypothetical protein
VLRGDSQSVSYAEYIPSMVGRVTNTKLHLIWKEVFMASFELLLRSLHYGTELKHENISHYSRLLERNLKPVLLEYD